MSVGHYENFPVASLALPARLRHPVRVIYRFARTADDIADEGDAPPATRIAALDAYRRQLDAIATGEKPAQPLFVEMATVVAAHRLSLEPFYDLLDAFEQDVTTTRYPDFDTVLDYCRRSANPVGRLMLELYGASLPPNIQKADCICTALQLVNFYQDVASDYARGRIYISTDDLARFGVSEAQIASGDTGGNWWPLFAAQIDRAQSILDRGAPLADLLPGRFGIELRMIVAGGRRIVHKLRDVRGDVFRRRPVLGLLDWPGILMRGLVPAGSAR